MSSPIPIRRPIRRTISLLIDAGPPGGGDWRFSLVTLLALVGPGSVPLGFVLSAAQNQVLTHNYGSGGISLFIAILTGGSVIVSRYQPVVAWLVWMTSAGWVAASAVVQSGEPWPVTAAGLLALLVVQFGLARDRRPIWSVGAWLTQIGLGYSIIQQISTNIAQQNLMLVALLSLAAMVAGLSVRAIRRAQERVATEERLTAEERSRRRLLEERTRIARELHDVVAHHMSVITVQAATAQYRLPGLPVEARNEFTSISEQARDSLTELRRLLSVLRDEDAATIREPQPGLDRLDGLADSVRRAGTPVELTVEGLPELPEAVSLTGYRIVQEALSNVVRHAPGADTVVRVSTDTENIRITVTNGPSSGQSDSGIVGAGLGLAGMRERVSILDGELSAEPTAEGGFTVRTVLPWRIKEAR